MNNTLLLIFIALIFAVFIYNNGQGPCSDEHFGALQSLYSNDGIQDAYLTNEQDGIYYDPYKYWRGVPWDLPTRNLNKMSYYPYLHEHHLDRYAMLYPYWSL